MRKNPPGYPLPDGELGEDEIVCQLVYLPNRDAYWQALYSAIGYFATWRAWERDDDKRGKDAASDWRTALELTTECWRMACLTEVIDRMDIMIDLLGNQTGCCGGTTIGPIITVVTNIVPGEGDDPAEWGETEVADWDEWLEYICYHAHVYVDSLISGSQAIDTAVALGSYTIDFFVGIMQFMQYLGLDQVLGLNQVMKVYEDFRDESDLSGWFTPLAEKFETAREEIVCAIMWGSSLSDAVEAAIDDNAVWLLFYDRTDYAAVQALIYEGTVDGVGYLAPVRRDDCDCGVSPGYSWQPATEITFTQAPDTFGRVNVVSVDLPEISIGRKVATSASWACPGYANGADAFNARHETYETLAMRITCVSINGAGSRYWDANCNVYSVDESRALYYTYDVAEGIDEDWANGQSTYHRKIAGGHAKRAADYEWVTGALANHDTTPGADPIESVWRVDFLVWVP